MDRDEVIRAHLAEVRVKLAIIDNMLKAKDAGTPEKQPETALPEAFAEFWALYPKKVGKAQAAKAWGENVPKGQEKQVISALKTRLNSQDWKKEGGRYIPMPFNWLGRKQWEEVSESQRRDNDKYGGLSQVL